MAIYINNAVRNNVCRVCSVQGDEGKRDEVKINQLPDILRQDSEPETDRDEALR